MDIPLLGLGTYKLIGKACTKVVKEALEIGYRHFDTAFAYENHRAIGEGIKDFDREKLFITTKVWLDQIDDTRIEKSIEKACNQALKELGVEYLDALLIHWPDRKRPLEKILEAMHKCKNKVRFPGVSNYTQHHLQDAYDAGLKVFFNQVEFHPYLYQKQLLEFCQKNQTRLIAYRPFGVGKLVKDEPLFTQIGERIGKTPFQVILQWIMQKNIPVIPKASSSRHLKENFDALHFSLPKEEIEKIDKLHHTVRYCSQEWEEFDY